MANTPAYRYPDTVKKVETAKEENIIIMAYKVIQGTMTWYSNNGMPSPITTPVTPSPQK